MNKKTNNKLTPEEQRRVKETFREIVKKYWDGEGSNTYSFCVLLYICLFTMILSSRLFGGNILYGSEEYSAFLGILAIFSIIEFIILYIFYSICKKRGYKEIFIKIMNYLAIITTIVTFITNA